LILRVAVSVPASWQDLKMTAAHWPVGAKAISACSFALPVDLRRLFVFRVSLSGTEISPASPLAVAGLNAGQVASDWPLMQGRLFPDGVDWSHGAFWALTNDPYLIHFLHRWWAWVVVAAMVLFARKVRKVPGARRAAIAIHAAFGTQVFLGIATVMSGVAIWLAALHQAVGALLVAATIWGASELGRKR